jgi:hypothetical protein
MNGFRFLSNARFLAQAALGRVLGSERRPMAWSDICPAVWARLAETSSFAVGKHESGTGDPGWRGFGLA